MIKVRAGQVWECSISGNGYSENDLITIGSRCDKEPLYFRVLPVNYDSKHMKRWISESYLNGSFELQTKKPKYSWPVNEL